MVHMTQKFPYKKLFITIFFFVLLMDPAVKTGECRICQIPDTFEFKTAEAGGMCENFGISDCEWVGRGSIDRG